MQGLSEATAVKDGLAAAGICWPFRHLTTFMEIFLYFRNIILYDREMQQTIETVQTHCIHLYEL
jgi:hypothetical protein